MAGTLGNELVEQLATKDDLERAVTRLKGTLALKKWMIGFILTFVVAICGGSCYRCRILDKFQRPCHRRARWPRASFD